MAVIATFVPKRLAQMLTEEETHLEEVKAFKRGRPYRTVTTLPSVPKNA